MDELLSQQGLEDYLKHHGLPLLDRFGQNFLIDHNVLNQIVSAVNPDPNVPIIEIGAGLGVLTLALAEKKESLKGNLPINQLAKIFSVELDRRIVPLLKKRLKEFKNVAVIQEDALKVFPQQVFDIDFATKDFSYDVIGNIPYNITSKLIRHVLSWQPRPRAITFLVDAEVAKRITANPPDLSVLALSVQVFASVKISGPIVQPESFIPRPKVKSAVLRMESRETPLVPENLQKDFFSLVRGGFAQKRKTLQNSLHALWHCSGEDAAKILLKAEVEPSRRAQTLTVAEWLKILSIKNKK